MDVTMWSEKTAEISRRHHWFPREMTSDKRAKKFHTDDVSLPRSWKCFWLVEANFLRGTTNQKHWPRSGDASSVWNFCARFSEVISRETSRVVAKCRLFSHTSPYVNSLISLPCSESPQLVSSRCCTWRCHNFAPRTEFLKTDDWPADYLFKRILMALYFRFTIFVAVDLPSS